MRIIETDTAPAAVGAYSQAAMNGDILFTAGQIPATPDGEVKNEAPIEDQTELVLNNLRAILKEEGLGLEDVLKTTVFLADIDDFEAMNDIYGSYFDENSPARSTIEAGNLPKGVGLEIEAIADRS